MTEPTPQYLTPWTEAIKAQEKAVAKGIDPLKVDNLRRAAIALVRACDDIKFDNPNHTILERRR